MPSTGVTNLFNLGHSGLTDRSVCICLVAKPTSGDDANHRSHTSIRQPQYVVLHAVAVERRLPDHVIQNDPCPDVINAVETTADSVLPPE